MRLIRMAREDRLAELADLDVELVTWRDVAARGARVAGAAGAARAGAAR